MMNAGRSNSTIIVSLQRGTSCSRSTHSSQRRGSGWKFFSDGIHLHLTAIFQATNDFQPLLSLSATDILIPASISVFRVGMHSQVLIAQPEHGNEDQPLHGLMRRVWVIALPPRQLTKTVLILSYLAQIDRLIFDLGRWKWRSGEGFFSYTTKQSKDLRNLSLSLSLPIAVKWSDHVHQRFVPNWGEIRRNDRPHKKAWFLWSMLHKAIALNEWRH